MNPVVMVVDDNSSIAQLLCIMLSTNGYTSISASSGLAALEMLETCPVPALILTDYAMPNLNGSEFIEIISSQPQLKDIPVLIISGSPIEDLKLPTTKNFKGLIQKPFTISNVLETVINIVPPVQLCSTDNTA